MSSEKAVQFKAVVVFLFRVKICSWSNMDINYKNYGFLMHFDQIFMCTFDLEFTYPGQSST